MTSINDTIEVSAATVDEAISQALEQLGAHQDDVAIEVISTPRAGVLGLGARQAKVRVTRRAPEAARSGVASPPPAPPLQPTKPGGTRGAPQRPTARPASQATMPSTPMAPQSAIDRDGGDIRSDGAAERVAPERTSPQASPPQRILEQRTSEQRTSPPRTSPDRPPRPSRPTPRPSRGEERPARMQERPTDREDSDADEPREAVESGSEAPRRSGDMVASAREATLILECILELMGEQATIEAGQADAETVELNIKGDGSGLLIGRHGQTLDAIEYVVSRALARRVKEPAPLSIDTESYRARRRQQLHRMALAKGEQAKREHVPVALDPMPPRDRRIIHMALKDDPLIMTRSTGEGFMRAIEIVPVDGRREGAPNRDNRGRGRERERERDRDHTPIGQQGGFKHGQKRIV